MQDIFAILNLAIGHHQAGRLDAAIAGYRRALEMDPGQPGALANLGSALCEQGRPDEAEDVLRRAVAIAPGNPEMHNNLGTALYEQGKLEAAIASFRQALALHPGHPEAQGNLGTAQFAAGRLDEAFASFQAELAAKPDSLSALSSLGTLSWQLGKLDEAVSFYRRLLTIAPGNGDALDRLAAVLMAQGDSNQALEMVRCSLHLRETAQNRSLFVQIVRPLRWTADSEVLRLLLTRAMTEPWDRPDRLAPTAAAMIGKGPVTGALVARAAKTWPKPLGAPELFGTTRLAALDADRLLLALLTTALNTDLELERFLTLARRALLDEESEGRSSEEGLEFRCALARQCFINEYVFSQDDSEIQQAGKLRDALAAALETGGPIRAASVAAVASYFPLAALPRLMDRQWPAPVGALLVQQIAEPAEERRLAAAIPAITPLDDAVSRLVQDQYEENPYPRWVKAAPPTIRDSVAGYLRRQYPLAAFARESRPQTAFLSAGCGTSLLAIEFARNMKVQILAVDLSLASLGYSKRKSEELALGNIAFAQGDIQALEGRFDVIECCGVLHHMADPFGAWRHLLTLLNPGGFMLVALYSQAARRGVVRARQFIAEKGYGSSARQIRRFRQDLLARPDAGDFNRVTNALDFFGISMCRDLLFHVQEQRMTLDAIAAFLKENGLTLLGFELDGEALAAYRRRFPGDPAANDLANWQAFEADNPDTFTGMYNFWVQKSA